MIQKLSKTVKLPNNKADEHVENTNSLHDDNDDDANRDEGEGSLDDDGDSDDGSEDDSDDDGEVQGTAEDSYFVDNVSLQVLYVQFFHTPGISRWLSKRSLPNSLLVASVNIHRPTNNRK